jgi:hypothetical protein
MARPEVTGKKIGTVNPSKPLLAYTIKSFCEAHSISESEYHNMKRNGLGPREMAVGRKGVRISHEAGAEWRREREAAGRRRREHKHGAAHTNQ